ncbi:MAG: radical SAM protein [Desulfovibrio sp.]|nr:radical SAM protein [Desulfovibrio sp.]
MTLLRDCANLTAQAYVMEQVTNYVTSVSNLRPVIHESCIAYEDEKRCVLVAYPTEYDPSLESLTTAKKRTTRVHAAIRDALRHSRCTLVTVLAPERPDCAPYNAAVNTDAYAFLRLPLSVSSSNLRNMLRRAGRECCIDVETFGEEHEYLLRAFCRSHALKESTKSIYARIGHYLSSCPEALLFAARARSDARLLALAVGDFASLTTAFYMFAARAANCPPGVADALLHALASEAERRGHAQLNLGLGINDGIRNFKRKWGQAQLLPYIETSWTRVLGDAEMQKSDPVMSIASLDGSLVAYAQSTKLTWRERLRHVFTGQARFLDCIQVEVSSHCPGGCHYCPHTTHKDVWCTRHMTEETFAALSPLVRCTRRVHLQGWGEPLLNPNFFRFAAAAHHVGCAVSTTTCGLGLNKKIARSLVDYGLDIVAFSLTGVDEQGNSARAGIPLAAVAEGIARVQEARRERKSSLPHIHLAYLLLASHIEQIVFLPDLMARLNVSTAVVSTLDYIPLPYLECEAYAPGDRRTGQALEILRLAAEQALADGRHIYYGLPGIEPLKECAEKIQSCLYVNADGELSPCVYCNPPTLEENPLRRVFGNARLSSPLTIWESPEFRQFRYSQMSGHCEEVCRACPKRFVRLR